MQYMPKKPKKWGLKAFSLADSKTGYTLNWKLCAGKIVLQGKSQIYFMSS